MFAFQEPDEIPVREPLPYETTPIYLSVPIIHVNGLPFNTLTSSPKSSIASPGMLEMVSCLVKPVSSKFAS